MAGDGKADSNVATVTITIAPGKSGEEKAEIVRDDSQRKVTVKVAADRSAEIASYDGKVKLSIPEGALDREAEIEITDHGRWGPKAGGMLNVFEMNAFVQEKRGEEKGEGAPQAGIMRREINKFKKGLTVSIQHTPEDLAGLDVDTLKLYYLDETTRQWVPVPSSKFDEKTGLLTATIDHFSFYGENAQPVIMGPGKVKAFQVDLHSGAAVSSYPIEVPPGSGGFQPSISLVYNSASVDEMKNKRSVGSWVGIGWSLSLGAIRYDAETGEYSLSFGGGSYDLVQDSQGGWHTVPESFYKITRTGQQWDVYDREGTYYRFGGTSDSEQYYDNSTYYRWDLNYMRDTNTANTITITYVRDVWTDPSTGKTRVRSAYPWHVRYNNDHVDIVFNSSYDAEVSGNGRLRNDNPRDPKPKVIENRKLDSIEIKVDGNLVRKYVFTYATQSYYRSNDYGGIDYAGTLRLTSITEYGADGVSSLPAMSFTYASLQTRLHDTDMEDYQGNPGNPAVFDRPYLTSVSNGYGAVITYTYTEKPSPSAENIWTREVVTTLTTNPGIGASVTTQYTYIGDPVYSKPNWLHEWADEYRGFAQVRVTDSEGNYTDHYFHTAGTPIAERATGKEYKTEWFTSSGQLLERKEYTWEYEPLAGAPAEGLVARWALNEAIGSMAYDSAGTNHGTIWGATRISEGVSGSRALSFDGNDDYVSALDSSSLDVTSGLTISAWVKPSELRHFAMFVSKYTDGDPTDAAYRGMMWENGKAEIRVFTNGTNHMHVKTQAQVFFVGQWTHFVGTWDGGDTPSALKIYINGQEVPVDGGEYINFTTIANSSEPLRIGCGRNSQQDLTYFFPGVIDEVRIYNRALSAGDVSDLYTFPDSVSSATYFVYLSAVTDTQGSKVSRTRYEYDDYGNVIAEYRDGDVSISEDDAVVRRVFYPNTSANILSNPAEERIYDYQNNLKGQTFYYYDGNNTSVSTPPTAGNLTRIEKFADAGTSVSTYFTYDSYGNVLTETDANGNVWTTTYESTYHTFPATISAPISGMTESYTFDPKTGNLLSRTDVNGQTTSYEYDTFGRLTKVIKPGDSSQSPSSKYEYNHWGTLGQQHLKSLAKVAEGDYLWSAQYFDGLGQVIQTQSRSEPGHVIVDSTTEYDSRGLVAREYVAQDLASLGPRSGAIAHWRFDEGEGAAVYDSAGTHNGTLYNGAARTSGKFGSALSFDGVDDYISVPESLDLNQFPQTIRAWIRPGSTGNEMRFIQVGRRYQIGITPDNRVSFSDTNGNGVTTNAGAVSNGEWVQIVAVFAGVAGQYVSFNNCKIYVNGISSATQRYGTNWSPTSNGALRMGGSATADEREILSDFGGFYGVGASRSRNWTLYESTLVTRIWTYHDNGDEGAPQNYVYIRRSSDGAVVWQGMSTGDQYSHWVYPNVTLPAGTYYCTTPAPKLAAQPSECILWPNTGVGEKSRRE